MGDTVLIQTTADEVVSIVTAGPQGPSGSEAATLTTTGDLLYRAALANDRLPIGSEGQVLKVSSGLPAWGAESGAVTSVNGATGAVTVATTAQGALADSAVQPGDLGTAASSDTGDFAAASHTHGNLSNDGKIGSTSGLPLKTGTAGVVEAGAFGAGAGEFCEGNDARLSDARTPTTHAASHAAAGGDPVFNQDLDTTDDVVFNSVGFGGDFTIDAGGLNWAGQNIFEVETNTFYDQSGNFAFGVGNTVEFSKKIRLQNTGDSTARVDLDADSVSASTTRNIAFPDASGTIALEGHTHAASDITSGTLAHERGGLEADVSAYSGLVKISGGATSAVTVTTAGEALLDDADAAAQRTTLGLGNSATLDTGTTAGTVAAGDHTHTQLHDRSHAITSTSDHTAGNWKVFHSNGSGEVVELALGDSGKVLQSNGATSAPTWETPSGGIGGSTGSTDNAILRADGTGGSTAQAADIVIDDATTSTQNNVAIVNNHSETNSALVLTPKGNGSLIFGPKPSGTGTTGNARGAYAVDFGRVNFSATLVASGTSSAILGGENNQASGTHSCVAGGQSNVASGGRTFVAGFSNTASGNYSSSIGWRNTTSANYGAISLGGRSIADRQGILAFASGTPWATNAGYAQTIIHVLWGKTTTNAAVELFAGDVNEGTTRLTVPSGRLFTGTLTIIGAKSDGTAAASYMRQVTIKNVAGTTSLVGTVNTIGTDEAASTSISITANDTNDAIKVECTGIASETWRWVCVANMAEMTYGS